jgi:putative membrane protein
VPAPPSSPFDPRTIQRPHESLLHYYIAVAALSFPGFPFVFLPLYFKYHTLRYRFDDEGVSMAWGILFRRETSLTYRRIQDIHVSRNLIQRWLGLATVSVQTASGTGGAEMSIEGILQADELRDFLYQKMRGAKEHDGHARADDATHDTAPADEALALLRDIRDALAPRTGARP